MVSDKHEPLSLYLVCAILSPHLCQNDRAARGRTFVLGVLLRRTVALLVAVARRQMRIAWVWRVACCSRNVGRVPRACCGMALVLAVRQADGYQAVVGGPTRCRLYTDTTPIRVPPSHPPADSNFLRCTLSLPWAWHGFCVCPTLEPAF